MSIVTAMAIDYSRTPTPQFPKLALHFGLLVLRTVTAGSLIAWHCVREAMAGWNHIWNKVPWPFSSELASLGFPVALPLAISLVIVTLFGSLFIILGLLTRSSAVILATFSIVTALLYHAHPATAQIAVHYAGSFLAIALCGPGLFACDRALRPSTSRHS